MGETITVQSTQHEEPIDITEAIRAILERNPMQNGIVHVYAQGATAGIMIQENWDDSVQLRCCIACLVMQIIFYPYSGNAFI